MNGLVWALDMAARYAGQLEQALQQKDEELKKLREHVEMLTTSKS